MSKESHIGRELQKLEQVTDNVSAVSVKNFHLMAKHYEIKIS